MAGFHINRMMDSYISEVSARQRREKLKTKTSQILHKISEKIKKQESPDTVADPFSGVPGHIKPLPEKEAVFAPSSPTPHASSVPHQAHQYVEIKHIQEVKHAKETALPKEWGKESIHLLLQKEEELKHLEEQVESKLNMLMEQRSSLSRKIQDVEEKEADLRALEIKIKSRQTMQRDAAKEDLQKDDGFTPLEKTLTEVAREQGLLQSREEDLASRKLLVEKDIREIEERLEKLKGQELDHRMHVEVFTKGQIAEFVDYVRDLISLGEYRKALKIQDMAQSMLLSANLPEKDEKHLRDILTEQYKTIQLAMLDLKR